MQLKRLILLLYFPQAIAVLVLMFLQRTFKENRYLQPLQILCNDSVASVCFLQWCKYFQVFCISHRTVGQDLPGLKQYTCHHLHGNKSSEKIRVSKK